MPLIRNNVIFIDVGIYKMQTIVVLKKKKDVFARENSAR